MFVNERERERVEQRGRESGKEMEIEEGGKREREEERGRREGERGKECVCR